MSASSLNICDSAKQILNHKIFTDDLKVYILKNSICTGNKQAPTLFETRTKIRKCCKFILLGDDADSAKHYSNKNNQANLDIIAKSLYVVSLGTQRKGLMKKNETKQSHATIPLSYSTHWLRGFHGRVVPKIKQGVISHSCYYCKRGILLNNLFYVKVVRILKNE